MSEEREGRRKREEEKGWGEGTGGVSNPQQKCQVSSHGLGREDSLWLIQDSVLFAE